MKDSPDLSPLAADYDIVGQLDDAASAAYARTYIATRKGDSAKRRDDPTGVLITVVTTPEGDEANALSHLAADAKLLARTPHRRLLPVVEGRWLGDDAFAVITQRTSDPSVLQLLASGQTFTNPRVAAILRDVNGLLEWAREQKIVHRTVAPSRIFLEPKTDRVRVSFAIAPIQRLHRLDAQDDAKTIARLAMALLTGGEGLRAGGRSLAELRPDLPERLSDAAATLLDEKQSDTDPDVPGFLALIGMADPVAAGEAERERIRAEILEEQRVEREKIVSERSAFEQQMSDERASFERAMAEERASFDRTMADQRAKLDAERLELETAVMRERDELKGALMAERTQIAATRAELERTVAEQRAELEQSAASDRESIAQLRESIRRAGELEIEKKRQTALDDITDTEDGLDRDALATPPFVTPMLAPLQPLTFDDRTPVLSDDEITFAPALVEEASLPLSAAEVDAEESRDSGSRRRWILWGSAAAILALIGIGASLIGIRAPVATPPRPIAAAALTPTPPQLAPVADSSAATFDLDSASMASASRWLDSLKEANPVVMPEATFTPRAARVVGEPATPRPQPLLAEDPFFIPGSTPPRSDTVVTRDTARPPR